MSLAVRNEWHKFQFLVAQVLWQWMELNRNSDLYQQFAPEEEASRPVNANSLMRPCKQACDLNLATALPLQWNPPTTRTEWNKWGSTTQDFALVFSFWTRWTQKHYQDAVKIHTWTQALALFVRYGGAFADFLQQCQCWYGGL